MYKLKNRIIVIFIIAFCAIIIFILWEKNEQYLGDNYYFLSEYEAIDIGFPDGAVIYKSGQKYLFNDIKIRGNIVDAISNSEFIIALEKNDNSHFKKSSLRYYIIIKKTDTIYGPYEKEEYLQKREKLNIPKKLILNE